MTVGKAEVAHSVSKVAGSAQWTVARGTYGLGVSRASEVLAFFPPKKIGNLEFKVKSPDFKYLFKCF